ncbi:MAG: aminotransferase class I/II-fold pyridoxal phosphate-dependent enzyme [Candidatus Thiodiazotropha sp.]
MISYRNDLLEKSKKQTNYAFTHQASVDLSLVTAPYVWDLNLNDIADNNFQDMIRSYGEPDGNTQFIDTLAKHEGVNRDCIMLTPGADVAIEIVFKQFLGCGSNGGIVIPTFPRFEIVMSSLDKVAIHYFNSLTELDKNYNLVALSSPNNPTTGEMDGRLLEETIKKFDETVFCIDAVLGIYGNLDFNSLVDSYNNVIVLKSFSKLGLAGLRLGYVVSTPEIINYLKTGMSPFSVPNIVQMIGLSVLQQYDRVSIIHDLISESWRQIDSAFGNKAIRKSNVPFYLLNLNVPSATAVSLLKKADISVVDGSYFRGLENNHIRIALGSKSDNECLIKAVMDNNLI